MPDLKLPQVRQWNVSLERALSAHDVVSLGYVGSNGRELIRREVGGPGTTPNFWFGLTTNNGFSNYQALQFQYRRRLAGNLQAMASYSWSHSIDNDSSDAALLWAGAGSPAANDVGSSDFDLRHSFTASVSYQFARGPFKGWRADAIFRARSGFPITVLESEQYTGIAFMNSFRPQFSGRQPDLDRRRNGAWRGAVEPGGVCHRRDRRAGGSGPKLDRRLRHVAGGCGDWAGVPLARPV